jgi:hypothetical protein
VIHPFAGTLSLVLATEVSLNSLIKLLRTLNADLYYEKDLSKLLGLFNKLSIYSLTGKIMSTSLLFLILNSFSD